MSRCRPQTASTPALRSVSGPASCAGPITTRSSAQKINTLSRFNDSLQADVQAAFTAAGFSPFEATDFLVTIGETTELTLDMPYDKGNIAPRTSLFIFGFSDAPGADAAEEILRSAKAVMTEYGIDIDEYCVTMYDGRYKRDRRRRAKRL